MNLPGRYNTVQAELKENNIEKEILIESLKYLPKFYQDQNLFKEASLLLDACLKEDVDVLKEIHQAYCDTLYKISAYQQLSYGAKKELLKEKGFEYILELLRHIYEERYDQLPEWEKKLKTLEQYLEEHTKDNLANLTMLFNLIYILKGKTLGLELALELVNCPDFIYLTWDIVADYKGELASYEDLPLPGDGQEVKAGDSYTVREGAILQDYIFNGVTWHKCTTYKDYLTPRQPFTAELTIWGSASSSLQSNIYKFVRSYMLPYVGIKLKFTDNMDPIYCYPSGDRSLLRSYNLVHYYTEQGLLVKHDLEHSVSDNAWRETDPFDLPLTIGQPIYNGTGFKGEVNLSNSYVESNGVKHYLYGTTKTIPDFITGTALQNLTEEGTVSFTGEDFIDIPLQDMDYILVDIQTGDQLNPYWEDDTFYRDTIIKYNSHLTVTGIHLNKTVGDINYDGLGDTEFLTIKDFNKYMDEEVYAGRMTNVYVENPANIMSFVIEDPYTRDHAGIEGPYVLKFTDAKINPNKYTGVGDIGILGSNEYFIYNGMLFDTNLNQIGVEDTWTDIGATHAVSNTYFTPGIVNGRLVYVKDGQIFSVERSQDGSVYPDAIYHDDEEDPWWEIPQHWADAEESSWEIISGYINEYYTAFGVCNGHLYKIFLEEEEKICYELFDLGTWRYITGSCYPETYNAYGIKNNKLYAIGREIVEIKLNGQSLTGWDPTFDCVSRYDHTNEDYITYGICQGNLYSICNQKLKLLDTGDWTAICGYYNDNSPRTFGYGIKNGVLYELQGENIVEKDNSNTWTDISGCTTATNNFVLGISNSNLYKINAKNTTPELLDEGGWTGVFGRYTTSTSANANCFGYGIKNDRLHVLHLTEDKLVSGTWKLNGIGAPINLADYNIQDITIDIDGQIISGIDNIKNAIPIGDEPLSTYDINVTYETLGFDNNTRYQIKTEMSREYRTYISPEFCRDNIYMNHAPEFDTTTSYLQGFTTCPLIKHGTQKINGDGEAYEFAFHKSYLEIPRLYEDIVDEYGFKRHIEKQLTQFKVKAGCTIDEKLRPLILTANGDGIFYGYFENKYGIFLNDLRFIPIANGESKEFFIKWEVTDVPDKGKLSYSLDDIDYLYLGTDQNPIYMERPVYLGGNEETQNSEKPGDGIFFLKEGFIEYNLEHYALYETGKYLSVDTLGLDTIERFISDGNQENQKVIEIQDSNYNPIVEFNMNKMYVSRIVQTDSNLNIVDNFCYNKLNIGDTEETTQSTLIYSGEYILDYEKATDYGNIADSYKYDTIAKNFTENDYIEYDPEEIIEFTTGEDVESQLLLTTEEHKAYTNQYLLKADLTGTYNDVEITKNKKKYKHLVPSGVIYEKNTQEPEIVTKTLEYNSEGFEVDETKISGYYQFKYDPYKAILYDFLNPDLDDDEDSDSDLDLDEDLDENIDENNNDNDSDEDSDEDSDQDGDSDEDEDEDNDAYCILYFSEEEPLKPIIEIHTYTNEKQKALGIGEKIVQIGNTTYEIITEDHWYNSTMEEITVDYDEETESYIYNGITLVYEEEVVIEGVTYSAYTGNEQIFYHYYHSEEHEIVDPTVYPWESDKDYWLKPTITRIDNGIQNITLHETSSTEPKDKFIIGEGLISNFSAENYVLPPTITDKDILVISYRADDDVSKDQGLFGLPNGQSVCIKDNSLCLCDNNGEILEVAGITIYNSYVFTLKFEKQENNEANIYISIEDDSNWISLFENTIQLQNNMFIGYADTGIEPLPFNGIVDLSKSFVEKNGIRTDFYDYSQITKFNISEDGITYDEDYPIIIETNYKVDELHFGFEFSGYLDMYGSDLLLPYELYWLEDRININTIIKQTKAELDPTYDPGLDPTIYTIKEYGIHLRNTPKRGDVITVTYTTEDHAYYMQPNTTYKLKCDVELDENGKCLLTPVNNPSWNAGVVGFENGYFTWEPQGYIILNVTSDNSDQTLCNMNDGQKLCIKDGKWQFFDDTNYYVITEAGGNIQFKLCFDSSEIEYNNGAGWVKSVEGFIGYSTLIIGNMFTGTIDLNNSYMVTNKKSMLFTPYKRVTPYIYDGEWHPLTLEPMLTINNVAFGKQFGGTLDLVASNLLGNGTYWTANQINIYAKIDMPEDNIHKDDLIKSVIRDNLTVDTTKYWTDSETVKINPEDLDLIITGLPNVGDVINLTYDTWYMFRLNNHEYDFQVLYNDKDRVQFSHKDIETGNEYIIYETDSQRLLLNTGYDFWGAISLKDSYRGGMMMCNYLVYNDYTIFYRRFGETEWMIWSRFSKQNTALVYERVGFELKGPLYMESSYVKKGNLFTPFLAHWDGTYLTIVGGPSIQNGIATDFSKDDYLLIKDYNLYNGDKVILDILFTDLQDQGISSGAYLSNSVVYCQDVPLQRVFSQYRMIMEYTIVNGKVKLQIIGDNSSNFEFGISTAKTLTIIPYNKNLGEYQSGYYVESIEDASKLQVSYRVGFVNYDHYNPPILEWYPVELQKQNIHYFGKDLEIYVAQINLGYEFDIAGNPINTNPDGLAYLDNESIEYRIVSPTITTYNRTSLYTNRLEKQATEF